MAERPLSGSSMAGLVFRPCGVAELAMADGVVVLRLGAGHRELASRLAALGEAGAFALVARRDDDEGTVLSIDVSLRSVMSVTPATRGAPMEAVEAAVRWLDALAALERRHVTLESLTLEDFLIEPGAALGGVRLVRALVGDAAGVDGSLNRWALPELATGPRSSRAVRMVALALYKALTGELPVDTSSPAAALRSAEEDAVPLPTAVARALPPGVEAALLQMLSPDGRYSIGEARRALVDASALVAERRARVGRPMARQVGPRTVERTEALGAMRTSSGLSRWVLASALLAAGVVVVVAGRPRHVSDRSGATALRARPLSSVAAATCAPCHEREVREWEGSVMAFASRSPLFGALESVVAEQIGRSTTCPGGAGVLSARGAERCVDPRSGVALAGAGGPEWCVRCHAPGSPRDGSVAGADPTTTRTAAERLGPHGREGIGCATCHESVGPVAAHGAARGSFEGNPEWRSPESGRTFSFRPEDRVGLLGIGNSGYRVEPGRLLGGAPPRVHSELAPAAAAYVRSSEACGACHDVRLFGTDAVSGPQRGERFKRLRNAYSEWRAYRDGELAAGRPASRCQDCHMSLFPGTCEASPGAAPRAGCPAGTAFAARGPGERGQRHGRPRASHWFTSVDLPLAHDVDARTFGGSLLDSDGVPLSLEARRLQLLTRAVRLSVGAVAVRGGRVEVPVTVENVGAGHRVPAGFSQERELWLELEVHDATGRLIYAVGKLARPDADLADKILLRTRVDELIRDGEGRPLGMFGADVIDGPDVPRWQPPIGSGTGAHVGSGLALFQNGFLRCVRCIGVLAADGACLPGPGQGRTRADRYEDGEYDLDSGRCRSNLQGGHELFETYFPVGALDASRGIAKAPDAILDSRSLAPRKPVTLLYRVPSASGSAPFSAHARLWFRSFPPFLVRAFAAYEASRARRGERRSGAQVDEAMLARIAPVPIAEARSP